MDHVSHAPAKQAYDDIEDYMRARKELGTHGRLVIHESDAVDEFNKNGRARYYLYPGVQNVALPDWMVFTRTFRSKSGRHRHQGGLVIYVLSGKGYTMVDDDRVDWEEGDLLMLPIRRGGVSHQHFNVQADRPSEWLALIYTPWFDALGESMDQEELAPLEPVEAPAHV